MPLIVVFTDVVKEMASEEVGNDSKLAVGMDAAKVVGISVEEIIDAVMADVKALVSGKSVGLVAEVPCKVFVEVEAAEMTIDESVDPVTRVVRESVLEAEFVESIPRVLVGIVIMDNSELLDEVFPPVLE